MAKKLSSSVREKVMQAASKTNFLSAAADTSGRRISLAEFGLRGSWRVLQTGLLYTYDAAEDTPCVKSW